MSGPLLPPERRARLAALAAVLVPEGPRVPGALGVDLLRDGGPVDRVLALRPDLAGALGPALDALPDPIDAGAVAALEAARPALFAALLQVVIGAWTIDPAVKRALGYAGQEALSLPRGGFGGEEHLEALLDGPPRWRDPRG